MGMCLSFNVLEKDVKVLIYIQENPNAGNKMQENRRKIKKLRNETRNVGKRWIVSQKHNVMQHSEKNAHLTIRAVRGGVTGK